MSCTGQSACFPGAVLFYLLLFIPTVVTLQFPTLSPPFPSLALEVSSAYVFPFQDFPTVFLNLPLNLDFLLSSSPTLLGSPPFLLAHPKALLCLCY